MSERIIILPAAMRAVAPMAHPHEEEGIKRSDIHGCLLTTTDDGFTVTSVDGKYAAIVRGQKGASKPENFPPVQGVIPTGKPIASVRLDPVRLAQLLTASNEIARDRGVVLEIHGPSVPIVVRAKGVFADEGEEFIGLLMPMLE